jgi:hypothetical protein
MVKRAMPTRTMPAVDMDQASSYRSIGGESQQYYMYRCRIGHQTRDVIAVDADHAREQTSAEVATELHPWPMKTLDDMRAEWPEMRLTEAGIKSFEKWMIAAVRIGMIDVETFDRMEVTVNAAKEARR